MKKQGWGKAAGRCAVGNHRTMNNEDQKPSVAESWGGHVGPPLQGCWLGETARSEGKHSMTPKPFALRAPGGWQ